MTEETVRSKLKTIRRRLSQAWGLGLVSLLVFALSTRFHSDLADVLGFLAFLPLFLTAPMVLWQDWRRRCPACKEKFGNEKDLQFCRRCGLDFDTPMSAVKPSSPAKSSPKPGSLREKQSTLHGKVVMAYIGFSIVAIAATFRFGIPAMLVAMVCGCCFFYWMALQHCSACDKTLGWFNWSRNRWCPKCGRDFDDEPV